MQQLPKIVRERLQAGEKPGVHPDPDSLTAFAENSLAERERLPLLEHLSNCAECREVLSLAQPELVIENVTAVAAASSAPSRPRWSSRLILNWAAVAVCIVAAVFLMRYQQRRKGSIQIAIKETAPAMNVSQPSKDEQPTAKGATQASASPTENELTAKLEPPVSPQSKSEAPADKNAGQTRDRFLARPMAKKSGDATASGAMAGTLGLRPAPQTPPSSEQVTVTGQADAVASTAQTNIPMQTRSFEAGVANQAAAAAAPAAMQKENQPASPNSPPSAVGSFAAGAMRGGAVTTAKARESVTQEAANRKLALARISSNYIPARWTISADGSTLLRSTDQGQTWDAVPVASNIVFRVVAALGPEVWVGGKAGALYHSSDQGMHWTQIKPTANGAALTEYIVGLDFSDAQHGKLTTSDGKVWTTNDGGANWEGP